MEESKTVSTPCNSSQMITKESESTTKEEMKNRSYRELVGSLIYLANATTWYCAANVLSRFYTDSQMKHWMTAKRVVRYLKETINYSITYEKDENEIQTYVDSDWAGDISDRRSCSGYVTMLVGGPVS